MAGDTKEPIPSEGERDESGRFKPGCKGGPGGSRKMPEHIRDMFEAATPKAAKKLIEALDATRHLVVGNGPGASVQEVPDMELQVKAANHILDRLYGKPAQAVTGEDGGPIKVDMGLLEALQRLAGG